MGGLGALLRKIFNVGGTSGGSAVGALGGLSGLLQPTTAAISREELEKERRQRALAFLGRSYVVDPFPEDDAPNIVIPGPLLDTPSSSIIPQETIVPQIIPAPKGEITEGLTGIRSEIDRINANIAELQKSLARSAILEQSYRQRLIKEKESRLAAIGKARSRRRSQRRRTELFETFKRPMNFVGGGRSGRILDQAKGIGIIGLGLELGSFIIDAIKKFLNIEKETEQPEPYQTPSTPPPSTGESPTPKVSPPKPTSPMGTVSGIDVETLAAATGAAEGNYDSVGPFTYAPMGHGLGRYQFMTGREDVKSIISNNAMNKGVSNKKVQDLLNRANSGGSGSGSAAKELLTYFPPESQDKLFKDHVQNTVAQIKKRYPNATTNLLIEKFGVYHLTGGDYPSRADTLGTTGKMHGQKILSEYLKLQKQKSKSKPTVQPKPVSKPMPDASKPGADAGGGFKIGDYISGPQGFLPMEMRPKMMTEPKIGMLPKESMMVKPTEVPKLNIGPVAKAPVFLDMRQQVKPVLNQNQVNSTEPNSVPSLDPKPFSSLYESILGVSA